MSRQRALHGLIAFLRTPPNPPRSAGRELASVSRTHCLFVGPLSRLPASQERGPGADVLVLTFHSSPAHPNARPVRCTRAGASRSHPRQPFHLSLVSLVTRHSRHSPLVNSGPHPNPLPLRGEGAGLGLKTHSLFVGPPAASPLRRRGGRSLARGRRPPPGLRHPISHLSPGHSSLRHSSFGPPPPLPRSAGRELAPVSTHNLFVGPPSRPPRFAGEGAGPLLAGGRPSVLLTPTVSHALRSHALRSPDTHRFSRPPFSRPPFS